MNNKFEMKHYTYILILFLCLVVPFNITAQKKHNKGERFKSMQTAFITNELDLSVKESEKFWPIFNEYRDASWEIRKEEKSLKKQAKVSEAGAGETFDKILELEHKKLEIRRQYMSQFKEILPAQKLVKLLYVEEEFKRKILYEYRDKYKNKKQQRSSDSDSGK